MEFRLLGDEDTSHRLISACHQLAAFPYDSHCKLAGWQLGGAG